MIARKMSIDATSRRIAPVLLASFDNAAEIGEARFCSDGWRNAEDAYAIDVFGHDQADETFIPAMDVKSHFDIAAQCFQRR